MRKYWLPFTVGAFAAGIAAASLELSVAEVQVFLGVAAVLLMAYGWYETRLRMGRFILSTASQAFFIGVVLAAGVGGSVWYQFRAQQSIEPLLDARVGELVELEVVLTDEPDNRDNTTLLTVRPVEFASDALPHANNSLHGSILLFADSYPRFAYGDRLLVRGKLAQPQAFETDSGRTFDYPAYLMARGIHYTMYRPQIEKMDGASGSMFIRGLFSIKSRFTSALNAVVPEPEASLLGGLLLGSKHALSPQLSEYLRRAGVIHIVVLSGYNLTIVAQAIERALFFLVLRYRLVLASGGILSFVLMTGAGASSVRAGLMALLVLLARALGRDYRVGRALLLAIVAMLVLNPAILLFDPSFQLSVLATLGLIYVAPLVGQVLRITASSWWQEIILATLATQIAVLPLLLYMTGDFSVVGLLVNLLILPLIPLTMLSGFIAGIMALLWVPLGILPGYVTYWLLHYELGVAAWFGSLPFATITVPNFSIWLLGLAYFLLGVFLWRSISKQTRADPTVTYTNAISRKMPTVKPPSVKVPYPPPVRHRMSNRRGETRKAL